MAKKKLKAKRKPAPRKRSSSSSALRNTVIKRSRAAKLQHIPWSTIPLEDLNPQIQRQFVVGHQVMVARVLIKKGGIVPLHSHVNEQVTYILDGALKFWIDGKEIIVHAGEVLTIPPHMPHKAEAMEDTI